MSDIDNKPTLGRKPLGLKRSVEAGEVKQTFSHGRTNKVVVEVKRRKLIGKPGEQPTAAEIAAPPPAPVAAPQPAPRPAAPSRPANVAPTGETRQELQARLLREAEEARMASLEAATRRQEDERARAADEQRRRADEGRTADQPIAEAPPAAAPAATPAPTEMPVAAVQPEAAPVAHQEPASAPAPEQTAVPTPAQAAAPAPTQAAAGSAVDAAARAPAPAASAAAPVPGPRRFTPVASPPPAPKRPEPVVAKKPVARDKAAAADNRRQSGKLTVTRALNEDEGARARSLAALKRAREKEKRAHYSGQSQPREKQVRDVVVPEAITVQELANRMAEKGADLVKVAVQDGHPWSPSIRRSTRTRPSCWSTEFGHNIRARVRERRRSSTRRLTSMPRRRWSRVRRWSRSWATSITARPACSTHCAVPTWCAAKRAASPSTWAPTRSRPRAANSITFLDTPGHAGLHPDAHARCERHRHRRAGGRGR